MYNQEYDIDLQIVWAPVPLDEGSESDQRGGERLLLLPDHDPPLGPPTRQQETIISHSYLLCIVYIVLFFQEVVTHF